MIRQFDGQGVGDTGLSFGIVVAGAAYKQLALLDPKNYAASGVNFFFRLQLPSIDFKPRALPRHCLWTSP